jgi:CheY-like chemotaxis protein
MDGAREKNQMKSVSNAGPSRAPPQSKQPVVASALADLRVLVVDDDADMRELVSAILVQEGAIATTADSAQSGFDALGTFHPQLLVSDIGMPGEDGYSLIRRVRALNASDGGTIPAIALTAFRRTEDRRLALIAGFDVHLGKPVLPETLVDAAIALAGSGR